VGKADGLLRGCRLVTVTGPGGVGKTRLAGEVARRVAARFADGVWLVELTAVQEPALVAAALQVHQPPDTSLMDAFAELCGTLLPAADDVRVLATSREPLGIAGEARYRLSPLPAPGDPAGTAASEAVALFADRARQVDPEFALTGESQALVAQIVARLDGMPLAIELAAARVESLGMGQLVERLDHRFALLTAGNRRAAPRQRSLAATVE